MKIIPAINSQTFEEVKNKIDLLKDLTKEFHIDVASENFCNYQTWSNPIDLEKIDEDIEIGLHLMLNLKPQEILKWNNKRVKKIILHLEGTDNPDGLIKIAKKIRRKIYIALSHSVEFEFIKKYLPYIDGVLILGVEPGKSGQKFIENTFEKIQETKNELQKNQKMTIDGGINKENISKIISLNPDFIILGSAIYSAGNPRESFLKFQNLAL
ncbi:MAG: hypothetical protein AAB371_00145 [Patescibacteria group bacterium]|mgnify:CR=1 FL=1